MMRAKYSFVQVLLFVALISSANATSAKKEYFTENELDLVRDAQELGPRVGVYLNLAERRLVILGVAEKSEKQKEKERKAEEQYEKEKKKAGPSKGPAVKPPVDEMAYLHDFTRSELLRGYIEALDEIMSNIDDNYQRKLDVRGPVEDLEKFSRETLPQLEKFEAKTGSEKTALQDAIDKAKETNAMAKEALKKVPKTEQKKKPPF
jgi:hypothetical protein